MTRAAFPQRNLLHCLILIAGTFALTGQTGGAPKRIELVQGGPPVTLDGSVTEGKEVFYVFQAKAGTKFNGQLIKKGGNVGFGVDDPEGNGLPEEEYDFNSKLTGSVVKAGDYKITVATFEKRPTQFTLVVKVY